MSDQARPIDPDGQKPDTTGRKPSRLLGEFFLIVAGVLVALAVESRWQAFQERRLEQAYIGAVVREIETNRADLARQRDNLRDRILNPADSLLSFGATGGLSEEVIGDLMLRATSVGSQAPSTRALESFVASPMWVNLDDPEISVRLTKLGDAIDVLTDSRAERWDHWFDRVEPWLRTRVDFQRWSNDGGSSASDGGQAADWSALLRNQELRNLIVHQKWLAEFEAQTIGSLLAEIDALLEVLGDRYD